MESLESSLNACDSLDQASNASLGSKHDGASSRHAGFSSRRVIANEGSLRAARMSLSDAGYVSLVSMWGSLSGETSRNLTPGGRIPDGFLSR